MIPAGLIPEEVSRSPLSCWGGQQINTHLHVLWRVSLDNAQGAQAFDMLGWVMFGEVVGKVDFAWCPANLKHFL